MNINTISALTSFRGTTAIRAVSDSHQETRKEAQLISRVIEQSKTKDNILFLNCGDLFGGVYPRESMVDTYLNFKKQAPNVEIVTTIGNNDPISQKDKFSKKPEAYDYKNSADFLKKTIERFENNGINVVCSNILDKTTGEYPDWVKPYSIVERDGDRIFVTGFCIDRLPNKALDIDVLNQDKALEKLAQYIKLEQPDAVMILNHDYFNKSELVQEKLKELGVGADLIIGGHDHDHVNSDFDKRIFCPDVFSKSMFEMDMKIKNNLTKIQNENLVYSDDLKINPELDKIVSDYEKDCAISDFVAPHTLNLPKFYAHPGSMGGFVADGLKEKAGADIAFFASNVIRVPLYYKENEDILNYDLRKIITFDSTAQKAEFNTEQLKEIFDSAFKDRIRLGEQNARFLQFSTNVEVVGKGNNEDKTYEIEQIFIDGEPLLDKNGEPLNPDRKFSCAFDNFIPKDGRSNALQEAKKEDIKDESGNNLRFDNMLCDLLKEAPQKYEKGLTYPSFTLNETIV